MNKEEFRIYLRALKQDDYIKTHSWRMDKTYQNGVVSQKRYVSLETEKNWVESKINRHEKGEEIHLIVALKSNNKSIGLVSLTSIDLINRKASMGSLIGINENRGKGYITEARYLMFEYGFMQLGLERIYAKILEYNTSSRKSAVKFGYVEEGIERRSIFKNGQYHNLVCYSMLKDEFIKRYGDIK